MPTYELALIVDLEISIEVDAEDEDGIAQGITNEKIRDAIGVAVRVEHDRLTKLVRDWDSSALTDLTELQRADQAVDDMRDREHGDVDYDSDDLGNEIRDASDDGDRGGQ